MRRTDIGLLLLLLTFVGLAVAWTTVIPPYENLDEIEHAEVIRYIADTGRLPVHAEAEAAGYHVRQEASQPPLYHLLGAAWVRLWGLPREAPTAEPIPGSLVACGSGETYYKRVTWRRDPYAGLDQDGHRRTVYGLRLLSILLQCATVAGTWSLARRIFRTGPVPLVAAAIVAFNPQFLLVSSAVNNDNLVTPLATWALVLLLDLWQGGPTSGRLIGFGVLSGLAALTKLSGLGLLGLGGLVVTVYAWQHRARFSRLVTWGLLLGSPALLLVAPWMLRNWQLYGDPTALAPMLEIVGYSTVRADLWGTLQLMTRSYWGQLPCAFYPDALYWPFFLLFGGGLIGVLVRRQDHRRVRDALLILGGWFAIIVGAWIRWNALTPATGGRLLFPAAPALAVILAVGWQQLHRHAARAWGIVLSVGAILALLAGAVPIFAPPVRLDGNTDPPNPIAAGFGEDIIRLRGYEQALINYEPACRLVQHSACRPALELSLYLEAVRPPDADWVLSVQLVSARPGDTDLRLRYDAWPGHGNLPTSTWPAGALLRERLVLPLPEGAYVTQAWDLQVAFYDHESRDRLPAYVDGQPAGDAVRLTTLRIEGDAPSCDPLLELAPVADFGGAIALTHARAEAAPAGWEVALCWESRSSIASDLTIFVHAYGADGTLLGTGDGPPMGGAYPTRLWVPGDRVMSRHILMPSAPPATIAVGLYDPETGERPAASVGGERQLHDAVVIWEADR